MLDEALHYGTGQDIRFSKVVTEQFSQIQPASTIPHCHLSHLTENVPNWPVNTGTMHGAYIEQYLLLI